jgi:hypothetical protein
MFECYDLAIQHWRSGRETILLVRFRSILTCYSNNYPYLNLFKLGSWGLCEMQLDSGGKTVGRDAAFNTAARCASSSVEYSVL